MTDLPARSDLLVRDAFQRALLGMIYPAIRKIVFGVRGLHLTLRVYLDRLPTEDDFEVARAITTEVLAACGFEDTFEECVFSLEPQASLDPLDGVVYARREQ